MQRESLRLNASTRPKLLKAVVSFLHDDEALSTGYGGSFLLLHAICVRLAERIELLMVALRLGAVIYDRQSVTYPNTHLYNILVRFTSFEFEGQGHT